MNFFNRLREYYRDPEYFVEVRKLALPIIAQQFMFSALNMVGVVFVGQKGETAVAAVNTISSVEQVAFVVFIGISNATSALVGNRIGAENEDEAYVYAVRPHRGFLFSSPPAPLPSGEGGE